MRSHLQQTNAAEISRALVHARRMSGSPAMDLVLTFIVMTDEATVGDDLATANELAREHPCRVIGVVSGDGRSSARLDATIRVGEHSSSESLLLRLAGPLVRHGESVVLPLLLPDAPSVVWWPHDAPASPSTDPIGRLAKRRLTDAETTSAPVRALRRVGRRYAPGDTDLSWTRLTPWRALLAAALDQCPGRVTSGTVVAGAGNPAAALLVAWLESRLGIDIAVRRTAGAQIVRVELTNARGTILLERSDERSVSFSVPGSAPRTVPLGRRRMAELLAEDLRRLDADEVYAETLTHLLGN
jgi:glucose-6-phosphate dehydrogenase assembly protein OpcA